MIEILEFLDKYIPWLIGICIAVIGIIASIKTAKKAKRREDISVPPVGVINDLPSSITGVNKYKH